MKAAVMSQRLTLSVNQVQWLKAIGISLLMIALWSLMSDLIAATVADEFQTATTKVENWVKGNIGKIGALLAVGVGSVMAGWKKDWSWFFGGIVIAVMIGVILSIITASFGATLAI